MPVAKPGSQGPAALRGRAFRRAFSLVEVLLTLAVIALLLGLLLPALGAARKQVALSSCTGHLRQMGQAYALYAADYGAYPEPVQWARCIVDRRVLFCPEDPGKRPTLSSYSFRTRVPPDLTPYWKLPRVDPATVLVVCGHHLGQEKKVRAPERTAVPAFPYKLVLRASGAVQRIHLSQIRQVDAGGPRPAFWRIYPGEAGYEQTP